ncbi:hypothetical protein TcWFU_005613 [Taenia crassiceps]|uniref:Uncharacterized protein n=1 Tax=Taenia crassiceps TaxID=6207 RepID=A0ABR4QL50_9CEST
MPPLCDRSWDKQRSLAPWGRLWHPPSSLFSRYPFASATASSADVLSARRDSIFVRVRPRVRGDGKKGEGDEEESEVVIKGTGECQIKLSLTHAEDESLCLSLPLSLDMFVKEGSRRLQC